jgi:hypothetical protein
LPLRTSLDKSAAHAVNSRARSEKWRDWIDGKIKNEVLAMHLRRVPWREINAAARDNDLPPSYWWEYFSDTYAVTQSIAIRRQIDDGENSISLGRLLHEIANHPEEITRQRWLDLWSGDGDPYWRNRAERQWQENFAGDDPDLLNPALPADAFDKLREGGAKMKRYVDRNIAHVDRRKLPPGQMPTYDDIDTAIDLIGSTFSSYFSLLTAASFLSLTPEIQTDWRAVFRVPWMPEDEDDD